MRLSDFLFGYSTEDAKIFKGYVEIKINEDVVINESNSKPGELIQRLKEIENHEEHSAIIIRIIKANGDILTEFGFQLEMQSRRRYYKNQKKK